MPKIVVFVKPEDEEEAERIMKCLLEVVRYLEKLKSLKPEGGGDA